MTVAEIRQAIGPDRFDRVKAHALKTATHTGQGMSTERGDDEVSGLSFELESLVREKFPDRLKRFECLLAVYREMPSYSLISVLFEHGAALRGMDAPFFFKQVRNLLSDASEAIAAPAGYLMWCGPFEDALLVADAWEQLTSGTVPDTLLRSLLAWCGPVPFALKRRIYDVALTKPAFHEAIVRSLIRSASETFGHIDRDEALEVLARIELPDTHPEYRMLKEQLPFFPDLETTLLYGLRPPLYKKAMQKLVGHVVDPDTLAERNREIVEAFRGWRERDLRAENIVEVWAVELSLQVRCNNGLASKIIGLLVGSTSDASPVLIAAEEDGIPSTDLLPRRGLAGIKPLQPRTCVPHPPVIANLVRQFERIARDLWVRGEQRSLLSRLLWCANFVDPSESGD